MKYLKRTKLALLALLTTSTAALAQSWQLVWQDEFNGSIGPDWVFETGTGTDGWGNAELQYYRQENATIENGALVITAKHENFGGKQYTSARLKTQGKKSWKYGRIEARIKIPSFMGSWPAFWMLGDNISQVVWPRCGEIDIMEHVNTEGVVHGTMHWFADHINSNANYSGNIATNVTDWHVYAIEWDANYIRWFRDGVQYHVADISNGVNGTSELHGNFFILLNFAIGGNWPGFTVDNNAFPAKMYVDWVRVYQWGSAPQPSAAQPRFMLVNKHSGGAIDLIGGNTSNGAQINQWSYDYNGPNQRWAVLPTPNGHFKLISGVSGKAASIENDSTANGAQLHAWDYIEGHTPMQWDFIDQGNGWFMIKNVHSGKVLDVLNWGTGNNVDIIQYDAHGGANQLWRLQPWGDYFIKASTGKYVCVQGASGNNGNNVIQYQWENNPWFKWRFESVGEGWVKASSLAALGRAIAIKYGSTAAAADAHLWDYAPTNTDQKLRIRPLTNGKFKFYFVHSGMTFDIPGGQTGNNVPLQQYPDNGNAWQQFELERVP